MKLPTGQRLAESTASVADLLKQYGLNFKGSINVYNTSQDLGSNGFILMDNGTVLAAAYTMMRITLYQFSALDRMMSLTSLRSEIIALTDDEMRAIMSEYQHATISSESGAPAAGDGKEAAVVEAQVEAPPASHQPEPAAPAAQPAAVPEPASPAGYEQLVSAFTALPGVLGSALVAEGFPVYQHGKDVDFEHIAAATEDMVRAGSRIASELQLGDTGQIILETPGYKVIIAPINDMFLCVLAQSDTNLGLIRLNIRNAQRSQED